MAPRISRFEDRPFSLKLVKMLTNSRSIWFHVTAMTFLESEYTVY